MPLQNGSQGNALLPFCNASNCTHELMMELKGSELEEERELFETCEGILSDKNFHDAPRFRAFLAKLRLAPSAERRQKDCMRL